ncbi:MAG TPA: alanine--tRNA ligase, partial [Byssovorax sp.]
MLKVPSSDVRRGFLDFFAQRGHEVVASAPLLPQHDPTLMFVNAGMVQFKDVFTGAESRPYQRATSSQKCIRISGKHNDLENVGVTARHQTFFEMLGNFSFGDYFKEEAIAYAWDLLTKVYEIPRDKLVITVFQGEQGFAPDDEARALWKGVTGFGDERVIGLGMKDNFWQMGETGPCGPCTEIHFWNGEGTPDLSKFLDEPPPDGKGWTEIWNLVFMQYERFVDGGGATTQRPLPKPCVDTGMGLERISCVLQGVTSNYDTDLLRPLVDKTAEIAGKAYTGGMADDDVSMRVVADHARATAFLIAEGVMPDKQKREYVLRRVMRRAIRHGHRLGIERPFLHEVALVCVDGMGAAYPELTERREMIARVTEDEEVRFRATLRRGMKILDERFADLRSAGEARLGAAAAADLYTTYGFPLDLTEVIAAESDFTVDVAGAEKIIHQEGDADGPIDPNAALDRVYHDIKGKHGATTFVGYERESAESSIAALVDKVEGGTRVVEVVVNETPFYGEAGGQVGDIGVITGDGLRMEVFDTQKPLGVVVHRAKVIEGAPAVGQRVTLTVDHAARSATRRNHSATHVLHWALRKVLGEHAQQKGSRVGPDVLRFDFSSNRAMSP